ncbi:MAG: tRNA pseudouridine(38-40) synthase TruA [Firmicutes bacterium]|nr:tRNA pseudouridine(38-40) synthase TruA [Bacillota bacterium]
MPNSELQPRNLKMIVAYEGTNYAGFQRQKNGILTIQGVLEEAIAKFSGETVRVIGAGRTDAGVHAQGQAVNFLLNNRLPLDQIQRAVNHFLPADILVKSIAEVGPDFHARRSAFSKTYSYRIFNSKLRPLFERNFVYHYQYQLDLEPMETALTLLLGKHDFRSFQAAGSAVKTTVRTINYCKIISTPPEIKIIINADGFLYHMARNIVGALLLVGSNRISLGKFVQIFEGASRSAAVPTAPAQGLCLEEVIYQAGFFRNPGSNKTEDY